MTKKIKSIVIVDGDRPSCQAEASPLSAGKTIVLNRNPSSSNKTRTLDNSTCTGSPSIPPNSSDKTVPDAPPSAPSHPVSLRLDCPQPVPVRSRSSAQHTPRAPPRTSGNPSSLYGLLLPPCAIDPTQPNFFLYSQIFPTSTDTFALECPCIGERGSSGRGRRSWPSPRR